MVVIVFIFYLLSGVAVRVLQIIQLVVQDVALSGDNQAVLAELAQRLKEESAPPAPFDHPIFGDQPQAALVGGLIGACVLRIAVLILGQLALNLTLQNTVILWMFFLHFPIEPSTTNDWLRLVYNVPIVGLFGGMYLIKTSLFHWLGWEKESKKPESSRFWTVFRDIIKFDLLLSVDNILAAEGVSHETWIIVLGVTLAILLLIFASPYMLQILKRFPLMQENVYLLIFSIGVELSIDSFATASPKLFKSVGLESGVPDWVKITIAIVIIGGTMLYTVYKRNQQAEGSQHIINFQPHPLVSDGYVITPYGENEGEYLVQLESASLVELINYNVKPTVLVSACRSRASSFVHFFGFRSIVERELAAIADEVTLPDDHGKVHVVFCCVGEEGKKVLDFGEFTAKELKEVQINPKILGLQFGEGRYLLPGIQYLESIYKEKTDIEFLHMVSMFFRTAWDISAVVQWRKDVAITLADSSLNPVLQEKLVVLWKEGNSSEIDIVDSYPVGVDVDPSDVIEYTSSKSLRLLAKHLHKELLHVGKLQKQVIYKRGTISADSHTLVQGRLHIVEKGKIPIGASSFELRIPSRGTFTVKW